VSSEIATSIPKRVARLRQPAARHELRALAVQLLGPVTMLAGFVWAIAQPYRIVFLDPEGKGLYDFLVQPPLLVVVVGVVYATLIAPGLVRDLDIEELDGPER
jgi:hypothetical protein